MYICYCIFLYSGLKPESPIRFTNCGHFFCYNCAKMATKCFICDIPVQPKEMNQDHMVSNLIRNCDIIAEVIEKKYEYILFLSKNRVTDNIVILQS